MSYPLKLAGMGIAIFAVGIIGVLLFEALWFRIGLGAAIAIVVGGLLLLAWRGDKKAREARAGLDRI